MLGRTNCYFEVAQHMQATPRYMVENHGNAVQLTVSLVLTPPITCICAWLSRGQTIAGRMQADQLFGLAIDAQSSIPTAQHSALTYRSTDVHG